MSLDYKPNVFPSLRIEFQYYEMSENNIKKNEKRCNIK